MHDGARRIIDDVIVSDIPLLYSPGQVGLAALMVTNEELQQTNNNNNTQVDVPRIDLLGYVQHRFDEKANLEFMRETLTELCSMLVGVREGKYGCGNHNVDLGALKNVHKKLKKVRVWGKSAKGKKRKTAGDEEPEAKRTKTL
jgi:cyclin H